MKQFLLPGRYAGEEHVTLTGGDFRYLIMVLRLVPGALLVGGATALQYRLQAGGGTGIPYAVFLALPGLLALFALAAARGRGGAPKALGTPAPGRRATSPAPP